MKAFYWKTGDDKEKTNVLALIQAACGEQLRAEEGDCLFTSGGTLMSFRPGGPEPHSMHLPAPALTFERVVVSPLLRFFRSAWSQAFLEQVNSSLAADGRVWLPFLRPQEAAATGLWSLEWLAGLLGPPKRVSERHQVAEFGRADPFPPAASVLAWYFRQYAQAALDHLTVRSSAVALGLAPACRDFAEVRKTLEPLEPAPPPSPETAAPMNVPAELKSYFGSMNYLVGGVAYKGALLGHMMGLYLGHRSDLAILDIGGGPGLLVMELALGSPKIARAVCLDYNLAYMLQARWPFAFYKDRLAGRFLMHLAPAQDYEFDAAYDVITEASTLLYCPRDKLPIVLGRAWESLRPGGILVIFENIKHPRFEKDYHVMFTVEELEGYLAKFGPIDYFSPMGTVALEPRDVGDKAVFRVVRKPI